MCGRVQLQLTWADLVALYRMDPWFALPDLSLPRYNIAPTQLHPVIIAAESGMTMRAMRWGFPALWLARQGKDPWKGGPPLINARAEEAAHKETWSAALRWRRCLVPTTGFYEWQKEGKKRWPLCFSPPGGGALTMGGLWGRFEREGSAVDCFAILTVPASADLLGVHDRMPVLLAPEDFAAWLDEQSAWSVVEALMKTAPPGSLQAREVSTALNAWSAEGPAVLEADWARA